MAKASGRKLTIGISTDAGTTYPVVANVISKSLTIDSAPIDVTDDQSDSWRELLAEPGLRSADVSVSGVLATTTLLDEILAATGSVTLQDCRLDFNSEFTLTGDFFLNNFSLTGDEAGANAVAFEASLQSSGPIVKA